MQTTASDRIASSLDSFLKKIDEHCYMLSKTQQPFGLCIITPNSPYIQLPTKEIRAELENRAREYFKTNQLGGILFRYFPPPLMPVPKENSTAKSIILDDYQHLTISEILSRRMADINVNEMTIRVQKKKVKTTSGLINMLSDWIGNAERKNQRKFFQNITNDSLEDIINKYSKKLFGNDGRLLPRDFLEKVHESRGTLQEWQNHIAKYCVDNSRLCFCVCIGLAAPFLHLLGEENGGFNLRGPSSGGKTTALKVALSVFGGEKMLHSWRATAPYS